MASSSTIPDVRPVVDGDVYRFRYNDAGMAKYSGPGRDPWWCFDGQVIADGGKLVDTYWSSGDSRVLEPHWIAANGSLEFVCNLHDVVPLSEGDVPYYEEADVFNLTHHHGHRKRYMRRVGSTRSRARMEDEIRRRLALVRSNVESALSRALLETSRLEQQQLRIEMGVPLEEIRL